jgi:predicted  nucleic acid-binding Zn-ribbon protein
MVDEQILSKTKGGKQKAEKLKAVRAKELQLEKEVDAGISEYATTIDRLTDVKQRRQASLGELSKLDGALASGKQYTGDLQTLIEDLTGELDELGRNVATMKDTRGMERLVARFNKKWARQMVVKRIREQNVDGSMKTILAYARGTVESLNSTIAKNADAYSKLQGTDVELSQKLVENQPKYEHWRQEVKRLEGEVAELDRRIQVADETSYAKLQTERSDLQGKLDEAKINETQYFEVLRNAKEAQPIVRAHMEGFKQAVAALTQNKVKTQEKIANLTNVFEGIYQIMETALEIKGFATIDKAINYAADSTTRVMTEQVEGILAETADRAEKRLIDDAKLKEYTDHLEQIIGAFDERMEQLESEYAEQR